MRHCSHNLKPVSDAEILSAYGFSARWAWVARVVDLRRAGDTRPLDELYASVTGLADEDAAWRLQSSWNNLPAALRGVLFRCV